MAHTRAKINLDWSKDITRFVQMLNADGTINKYILETYDGTVRVDARSYLGVLYFASEHGDEIYLVNDTSDGDFPLGLNDFYC